MDNKRDYITEIDNAVTNKDVDWFVNNLNITEVWMLVYDILDTAGLTIDDFEEIATRAEHRDDGFFTYVIAKSFVELLRDRKGINTAADKNKFIEESKILFNQDGFMKNDLMACATRGEGYDSVMDVRSDEYRRYFIAQTLRAQNASKDDVDAFFFDEDDTVLSRYNIPAMFA